VLILSTDYLTDRLISTLDMLFSYIKELKKMNYSFLCKGTDFLYAL